MSKKQINANTYWEKVLELIEEDKFSKDYPDYVLNKRTNGYLIMGKEKNIFLFNKQREIEFYFPAEGQHKVKIYSSDEIERYIKSKNKDITKLYIKDGRNNRYKDCIENLGYILKNSKLEIRQKSPLPDFQLQDALSLDEDYSPNEYSKYFYKYFFYEDQTKDNEKILFQNNEMREIIFDNILSKLMNNEKIKAFKFTGPSSIGKSLTLLRLSRISYNIAYINLKAINECKADLLQSYSIVMSELERFNVKNKLQDFLNVINNNYNDNESYLKLLLNIMKFLSEFNDKFVFIFDQFKLKYIIDGFMEEIKKFNNINIVLCSSINDKNIRNECLKTWLEKGKNILKLEPDNQDFYFYFEKIFSSKKSDCKNNNIVFRQFAYMPKYINKYKHYSDKNKIYEEVKTYIKNKIDEFCVSNELEKSLVYSNLRYIANKEYEYDKFNDIIKYCPLKFFIIKFYADYFKIKYLFPFIKNVINYEYTENECYTYFKNELYKKDRITNNLIKGDYFEAAAKLGLMNLELPEKNNDSVKILNEIVSMDKIIDNKNNYYIEEIDENNDEEEEKKEIKDENYKNINDILLKKKEENNNNIKIQENNEEQKYKYPENEDVEEKEKEEEEEEEEEEKDSEESELLEKEENNAENKEFEVLLKKFSEDEKKNNSNKEKWIGFAKEVKLYYKTIEDYRLEEIKEQRKEKQIFTKSLINGDDSIFLDQYSKFGKTLDFAYIYGDKNDKVFIGFQMKCYFENSTIKNKFINKNSIKKSCRKILVNSMKLFNCKITKWYYYLVFYYNPNNKNENLSKKVINKCKLNDISFFFYDPIDKKFYNKQKNKLIVMQKLPMNKIADLETNIIDMDKYTFNLPKENILNICQKRVTIINEFIEDLSKTLNLHNPNLKEILSKIESNLGIKDYWVGFHSKCNFNKSLICPKKDQCILLYKKKPVNDKIGFIAGTKEKKKIKYQDILTGEELKHIYELLDEDADYYYCLIKTIKPKKRTLKDYLNSKSKNAFC